MCLGWANVAPTVFAEYRKASFLHVSGARLGDTESVQPAQVDDRGHMYPVRNEHEDVARVGPHPIDAPLRWCIEVDEVRLTAQVVLDAEWISLVYERLLVA